MRFADRIRSSTRSTVLILSLLVCTASLLLTPVAEAQDPEAPPRSDTITEVSQFLACAGNAYALCYYSGSPTIPTGTKKPVPALPCELGEDGLVANCKCYAIDDPKSTNFVALPSILNPKIRQQNEEACGENGKGCWNLFNHDRCSANPSADDCGRAPVCDNLGDLTTGQGQSFYPKGELISTFSFKNADRYPISSTDCSEEPYIRYAGCMTAPCGPSYEENGVTFTDCKCPTYVGPFQYGQTIPDVGCDLGQDYVWSAANTTMSLPAPPRDSDKQ